VDNVSAQANYVWNIQGNTYEGTTISTGLLPINSNNSDLILVEINAQDSISGCQISTSQLIPISPTPILQLDTNVNYWNTAGLFNLCDGDYISPSLAPTSKPNAITVRLYPSE
jgi:hypothetical protein